MSVDINKKPLRKYDCELEASQSRVVFIPLFPFCRITLTAKIPPNPAYPKKLETIGHHLRKRRLDLKLKQEDVARRIGLDVVSIHKWETNKCTPQVRYFPRIIDFLGYYPYDVPDNTTGQLVAARHHLGLSQKQLAKRLDIDPATLAGWEVGRRTPGKKYQERINELLKGITLRVEV